MVQGQVDVSSWETVSFAKLMQVTTQAKDEGKWLFIWDKQGSVGTFFTYKGVHCDFGREVINATLNRKTKEEALDEVRRTLVCAQRTGDNYLLDLE